MLVALSVLLLVATADSPPAAAASSAGPAASAPVASPAEGETKKNLDKVVCHMEADTGSRFVKKRCQTLREWEKLRKASQEKVRETQTRTAPAPAE